MVADKNEALQLAAFHLRMNLLGHSSYSGTPSKVDKGWAELIADRLELFGYEIAPIKDPR